MRVKKSIQPHRMVIPNLKMTLCQKNTTKKNMAAMQGDIMLCYIQL